MPTVAGNSLKLLLFAIATSSSSVHAINWHPVESGNSRWSIFVDVDAIRLQGEDVVYRVRASNDYMGSDGRTAVANCLKKEKFEVLSSSDWVDRPFKSTYPNTLGGFEVSFVCDYAEKIGLIKKALPVKPPVQSSPIEAPSAPQKPKADNNTPKSYGSGFAISAGAIITNNHVVSGCERLSVRQGNKITPAMLQATYAVGDLALLISGVVLKSYPGLRQSALLGEEVMVAGHPLSGLLSSDIIVTSGQVNSLAGLGNDPTQLQISAPVQPGNSGGPLIDKFGNIVGVVVSKLDVAKAQKLTGDIAQNINFAVKPEVLKLFLEANQVSTGPTQSNKRLEGTELAQRARGFTYQVICY